MFSTTKLATNVVIDTKIDESFSVNDDPVSLKMYVTYEMIEIMPERKLNTNDVKEMKNAFFACGVPEIEFIHSYSSQRVRNWLFTEISEF